MVAEAGWYAKRDHIGIAYVLARRWRQVVRRLPHLRFVDIIRLYCTALRPRRRQPSARQRWLLALHGPERPAGWPSHKADWDVYRPRWRATYERAGDFLEGRLRDPCKGKAMHWGGDMDLELADKKGLVPVDCGDTRNTFLGLPKKEASELDAGAKKPEA